MNKSPNFCGGKRKKDRKSKDNSGAESDDDSGFIKVSEEINNTEEDGEPMETSLESTACLYPDIIVKECAVIIGIDDEKTEENAPSVFPSSACSTAQSTKNVNEKESSDGVAAATANSNALHLQSESPLEASFCHQASTLSFTSVGTTVNESLKKCAQVKPETQFCSLLTTEPNSNSNKNDPPVSSTFPKKASFCEPAQRQSSKNSSVDITTNNNENNKISIKQSPPNESLLKPHSYAQAAKSNNISASFMSSGYSKEMSYCCQTNSPTFSNSKYQAKNQNKPLVGKAASSNKPPSIIRSSVEGIVKVILALFLKDTKESSKQSQKTAKKKALNEYNILILGGSGTGKSTFINAYANYEKYATIEDAEQNEFVELISSSFKLAHPETEKEFRVESGHDANESNIPDQSRTQGPMAYRFTFADKIICLIDTPGMGDTGGLKVDKENFEKILEYLKNYQTLHGIIIMTKSNETRNMTAFNYCITELFSRLHRSASENIFFCFTFSRNTFFRAGDGLYLLNQMLNEEFPDAKLKLKPKVNCFFIDNEAYRYLVAKKAGYPFETDQIATFTEAWNKSADQTRQMFSRIIEKSPHNLQHTFNLNMAQNFIAELAELIVRLQRNIFFKMNTIKRQKQSINSNVSTVEELHNSLYMTVPDMKMVALETPNTVCASNNCIETVLVNGVRNAEFKKCCFACSEKGVKANLKNCLLLKSCKIFNMNGNFFNNCYECGCSWKEHMHVKYEYQPVQKKVIDPEKEEELKSLWNLKSNVLISRKIIEALKNIICELTEEMEHIQRAAACFGYLLNKHSNLSCNQFIEPHLELLIEEEKMKIKFIKDYSDETLSMLECLKITHSDYVKEIKRKVANGSPMELEEIDKLVYKLCQLKHSGQEFQTLVNQFLKDNAKKVAHVERVGLDMSENQ